MNAIHIQENKTTNYFSIVFFSHFAYYVLSQQSPIPFICLPIFFHSSPTLSRLHLMQTLIAISIVAVSQATTYIFTVVYVVSLYLQVSRQSQLIIFNIFSRNVPCNVNLYREHR